MNTKELTKKALEFKEALETNLLSIRFVNGQVTLHMSDFNDVPNINVTYSKWDDADTYEKKAVIDDVVILAIGSKEEMRREFNDETAEDDETDE